MSRRFITGLAAVLVVTFSGCASPPLQGGFQEVSEKLVAMGPAERAIHVGANGKHYEQAYGIYFDGATDAIYTKTAAGEREYVLEGDIVRATFLIDRRKNKK